MMDFTTVKNIVIPEGPVKKIEIGGQTVWKAYDAEIEYLGAAGDQYIDTDIIPNGNTGAYVKAYDSEYWRAVIGMRQNSAATYWVVGYNSQQWFAGMGSLVYSGIAPRTATTSFNFLNDKKYIVDDNLISDNLTMSFTATYPIRLIGYNGYGAAGLMGRFYFAKISQGDEIIRDFIPVRIGTTGYLYDKIQGKLYSNTGTGSFTLGPDVNVL